MIMIMSISQSHFPYKTVLRVQWVLLCQPGIGVGFLPVRVSQLSDVSESQQTPDVRTAGLTELVQNYDPSYS